MEGRVFVSSSFAILSLLFILVCCSPAFATVVSYYPTAGTDTTSGTHTLTSSDLGKLNASDDNRYRSRGSWTNCNYDPNRYIDFNFTPGIPDDAIITDAVITFEWQIGSIWIYGGKIQIWEQDSGTWHTYTLQLPSVGTDKTETIDVSSYINTSYDINNFKIKFQAHNGGCHNGGYTHHDLVELTVNYTLPCDSHADETSCNADPNCDWCPQCDGNKVNQWNQGKCVDRGTDCGYHCVKDVCDAKCDGDDDCSDRCDGDTRLYNGTCNLDTCTCSYQSEDCNDNDGCYPYDSGCEERDYYCLNGACDYNYSNRHNDSYDDYVYYCENDYLRMHRMLHDYYCVCGTTCQDHTSWVDDQLVENCNDNDGWYNTINTQWISTGECTEKEQVEQEYRDYYCNETCADCEYIVTNHRWVDTGNTRNKPDGTSCDDGLYCTIDDQCLDGVCNGTPRTCDDGVSCTIDSCDEQSDRCVNTPDDSYCDDGLWCNGVETCDPVDDCQPGTPVDCSPFDMPEIATCFNDPDNNPFTWDYAPPFTSVCDEDLDQCTTGSYTFTHTCSVDQCSAECDDTHPCANNTCSETYFDYCLGHKLVEYDNDKIMDNTTVTDSCANTCQSDCTCTNCTTNCSAPETSTYCVKGVCGAECDSDGDCACPADGCVGNDYYDYPDYGSCLDDCGCGLCEPTIYENDERCDNEGPETTNLTIQTKCNRINISATITDQSIVEEAEFFFDECPSENIRGEPLYATDGAFDETTEDVYRNDVGVSHLGDGRHNLYVRGKDEHGNWGECASVGFDVDTEGPTTMEQNVLVHAPPYMACGINPEVNASICDDESIIVRAEYFIDDFTLPNGAGFPMDPTDGTWNDRCEWVNATINITPLSEGTHYVKVHGMDEACNWGKLGMLTPVSFIKDTVAPSTTKIVNEPKVECDYTNDGERDVESCWFVNQNTIINLSARDYNPGDDEYSGNPDLGGYVHIYCKSRWKENMEDEWSEWSEARRCDEPFTFENDSIHEIEYWAVDLCGNEEEHHFEIDIVDTQPPVTVKSVGEPKASGDGFTWITQNTKIILNCTDPEPHPVNDVTLYWRYKVDDGEWVEFVDEDGYAEFSFDEDSNHTLEYHCVDALGNEEETHVQYYKVDTNPPNTTKSYGTPFHTDGLHEWIKTTTPITLTVTDQGACAVDNVTTYYMNTLVDASYCEEPETCIPLHDYEDPGWIEYTGPFFKEEESCHMIEYWSIDALGNRETIKAQCVSVDDTPPETTKSFGEPNCSPERCDSEYWTVNSSTPFTLTATDNKAGVNETYYRYCSGIDNCSDDWNIYSSTFHVTGLEDGEFRLEYYSKDNLGNDEEIKYEIDYLDNTPPVTTITFPPNNTWQSTDFSVHITDDDHCLDTCYYRVHNGTDWTGWMERECNSDVTIDVDGCDPCLKQNITVEAYAKDCLGQIGNIDSRTYGIDTFWPPEIVMAGPSGTVESLDVMLYAETNKPSVCRFDFNPISFDNMAYEMNTTDKFNHTYTWTFDHDGIKAVYLRCRDMAGNKMRLSETLVFYVNTAGNYNITIPDNEGWGPGWHSFFLPRTILNEAGVTNFSIPSILESIRGEYEIIFYYNGTEWLSYAPGRPINSLTEFTDDENKPYWIKIKDDASYARIEIR